MGDHSPLYWVMGSEGMNGSLWLLNAPNGLIWLSMASNELLMTPSNGHLLLLIDLIDDDNFYFFLGGGSTEEVITPTFGGRSPPGV